MPSFARGSIVLATVLASGVAFGGNPQNASNTNAQNANSKNAFVQAPSNVHQNSAQNVANAGKPVAYRLFTNAVNSLREESAGSNRLTNEQTQQIESITKEFNAKLVAFRNQHATEFNAYRQAVEPAKNNANNTQPAFTRQKQNGQIAFIAAKPVERNQTTPEQAKAQFQAQVDFLKISRQAPKVAEIYPKVWNVLNASQRQAVTASIESARAQWTAQNPDAFNERVARNGFDVNTLPADQRERFQAMSPTERAKFVRQWRETRQSNAGGDQ